LAPIPLVSTDWLAERLGEPSLKVIDASFKMPGVTPTAHVDYEAAHIRGAVFFDHDDIADPASRPPHMLPSAPLFAEKVEALGLGDADLIVAYDSSGLGATRAWWAFRAFGHDAIAVLDGGLTKWRQEGRAVTQAQIHPAPTAFTPHFRPHLVRSVADMLANARTFVEQVIDARSAGRFEGRDPEPRPGLRSGHIPGSRNLD
jgi:thiosulfate/3-mercaptopyruvate sulfurtransferase